MVISLPTVSSIFFSSLGFPDLETGSCRWGSSNCGFFFLLVGFCQLWDFFSSSRLSGFGNRVVQGGSFFLLSAFRIWKQGAVSVICRGVDLVNFVICNFRFRDYRIWKQCCGLDLMICRRACISRCLSNVLFVNDGSHVTGVKSKTIWVTLLSCHVGVR